MLYTFTDFLTFKELFLDYKAVSFKGIFSDCNKIFIYRESEDIKSPKFELQVMHDYVVIHCSIDYCVELTLVNETV